MSCPTIHKVCPRLIVSTGLNFTNGVLTISIPNQTYANGEKYCIVIAQDMPTNATIVGTVAIRIGTATTTYPLLNNDCTSVRPCHIKRGMRYSTKVVTDVEGGVFKLLGKPCGCCCYEPTAPASLPLPVTVQATQV